MSRLVILSVILSLVILSSRATANVAEPVTVQAVPVAKVAVASVPIIARARIGLLERLRIFRSMRKSRVNVAISGVAVTACDAPVAACIGCGE